MIKQSRNNPPSVLTDSLVVISGAHEFKNALISYYLEQKGGAQCSITDSLGIALQIAKDHQAQYKVIIVDAEQFDSDTTSRIIGQNPATDDANLVLFDVDKDTGLETNALKWGIKGFFYSSDPLELFPRGLKLVIDGELWVSRAILENALMGRNSNGPVHNDNYNLTERERQILGMIGSGVRNADIADSLCISPHTVKTHIYNVFRKIGVSNRVQAARWADDHL